MWTGRNRQSPSRRWRTRFGLSKDFAARANTATPSGMWFPDKDELVREKVVTRVVQPPPAPKAAPGSVTPNANAAPATVAPAPTTPARAAAGEGRATIPADVIKRLSSDMARLGMKKEAAPPAVEAVPAGTDPAAAAPASEQK
jgi:hypothetical protein